MQIACPCLLAAAGYTHCKDIQKLPWTSPQPLLLSSYLGDQFDLFLSFNNDFFIVWEFHAIYFDLSPQILPNHPYLLTIQFSFSFKNMKKKAHGVQLGLSDFGAWNLPLEWLMDPVKLEKLIFLLLEHVKSEYFVGYNCFLMFCKIFPGTKEKVFFSVLFIIIWYTLYMR